MREANYVNATSRVRDLMAGGLGQVAARAMVADELDISQGTLRSYITRAKKAEQKAARSALYPQRHILEIENGMVIIAGDAHYWPGIITPAHKGLVKLTRELKPVALIANGDIIDGSTISRHPPIGWEKNPDVIEELETSQQRLGEWRDAAPKAELVWDLGNHDARFETRLATVAPEYARVKGIHLNDHFPDWSPAWSTWINGEVVVKHRFKGGVHATHNNTVASGKSMVTGHDHTLKITPYTDYNGTRYGASSGTLAEKFGPQFVNYTEDAPVNWQPGFLVLTFFKGQLLPPEPAVVIGDSIVFRGRVLRVA